MASKRPFAEGIPGTPGVGGPDYQLTVLLAAGIREQLQLAEAFILRGDMARKVQAISEACALLGDLKRALASDTSGEIAAVLEALCGHVQHRLFEAGLCNDAGPLRDVFSLLSEIVARLQDEAEPAARETVRPAVMSH